MSTKDRQTQVRAATADAIAWQDHGDHAARARAIASVEPLIWHHARRAHRRVGRFGVQLEDLVGAGREGATIATDKLDRTRGDYAVVASLYIRGQVDEAARRQSGAVAYGTGRRARDLEIVVNRAIAEGENAGLTVNQSIGYAAEVAGIDAGEALAISRRSHATSFDQEKHDVGDEDDTALNALHDQRVASILDVCLSDLRPSHAAVIRRHYIDGRTLSDIAAQEGVTPQSVSNRHRLAIERLGEVMRERGLRAEDLL